MAFIKDLKNKMLEIKIKHRFTEELKHEPPSSAENGYKLSVDTILKEEFPTYFISQLDNYIKTIKDINQTGFVSVEIGEMLENLMYDKSGKKSNNQLYIKTIHSRDLDSIFNEGIRCFGSMSSLGSAPPTKLSNVVLTNTISPINSMMIMISALKNTTFFSAGLNPVNQTLILSIPKNLTKSDILYWNEKSKTFNVKPEFIIGSAPISKDSIVKELTLREKDSPEPTL